MLLRINFRRKLATHISRLTPRHMIDQNASNQDKSLPQELYESIAVGNALAEIEDKANRYWRGN